MQYVIFWGWNEEGEAMFESRDGLQTTNLKKATKFISEDAADLYLADNYDVVPHAEVITTAKAQTIKPKA